ncbi:NADH-quinone oxidoreductase subunit NuoK [Actinocatenispora sera]|uniref:NADH-quinone oxidoreductase subunit NuoK n=1 Tax=Actinocatenispora sera TaxID=390989 RepID=UPI003408772B
MHPVIPYLIAALLFGVGCYGVLVRRNAVLLLMSLELMLNAVNLILVTADTSIVGVPRSGQVFALFVIVLATAEVGVGLAVVLRFFRLRGSVDTDLLDTRRTGDGAGGAVRAEHTAGGTAADPETAAVTVADTDPGTGEVR